MILCDALEASLKESGVSIGSSASGVWRPCTRRPTEMVNERLSRSSTSTLPARHFADETLGRLADQVDSRAGGSGTTFRPEVRHVVYVVYVV